MPFLVFSHCLCLLATPCCGQLPCRGQSWRPASAMMIIMMDPCVFGLVFFFFCRRVVEWKMTNLHAATSNGPGLVCFPASALSMAWNRLCLCKCRSFRRQQVSNTISNKQQGQTCRVSIRVIGDGMVNVVFVYTCVWCGVVCLPGLYVYLRVCVCVGGCVSRGRNCARNVWLACFSCICTVYSLHSPPIACHKFAWYSFESDQASWGSSSSQRSGHLPIQLLVSPGSVSASNPIIKLAPFPRHKQGSQGNCLLMLC
ncbi:hypothetical protein BJ166DRAFT_506299 [Pestalotiopsis sp. NC0098]|nr:hypothetical protein BJ166DRAFT_506299 [Pestalotiopsis sp. NC0098]